QDDDVGVVLLGIREDLPRRVPERGRPYVSLGVNSRLPQRADTVLDRLGRLLIGLARHIPHLGDNLLLQQVQDPHLALGQQGQILGGVNHPGETSEWSTATSSLSYIDQPHSLPNRLSH